MWFVSGLRIGNAKRTGFGDLPRDRRTSPHKVNKLVIAFFVSLLRPYLIVTTYSFFKKMNPRNKKGKARTSGAASGKRKADEGANAAAKALQVAAQKAKAKDGKVAKSKESKGKKQEAKAAAKRKGGAVAAERLKADIVATIARRKFAKPPPRQATGKVLTVERGRGAARRAMWAA